MGDYLLTYVSIHSFFIHDEINIDICGVWVPLADFIQTDKITDGPKTHFSYVGGLSF